MSDKVSSTFDPSVEYRDIPGFPDYKIGADGSVWSRKGHFINRSQR